MSLQPCAGTQASLPNTCQCADPGVVSIGQNVIVSDGNLCPRRLLPPRDTGGNIISGVLALVGSGADGQILLTAQPNLPAPTLTPASASFGSLLVASGGNSALYRLTPPGSTGLFLQTDGAGALVFGAPPAATVPDPLSVNTLNVATALNSNGTATFAGAIDAPGVATGTIVSLLGLNGSNQVVKGTVSLISKSWYYESGGQNRNSTTFPNYNLLANSQITFAGSEMYNSDGITSFISGTSVKINAAGAYQIDWKGAFAQPLNNGTGNPGISLQINGAIVNPAQRGLITGNTYNSSVSISGTHVYQANANDVITLQLVYPSTTIPTGANGTPASSGGTNGFSLRDVEVFFTKFK